MSNNRINDIYIENANIPKSGYFRNFAGAPAKFNPAGNRNFTILLDPHVADMMASDGWNVRYIKPREEGDDPQPCIKVNVKMDGPYPPSIFTCSGNGVLTPITKETIDEFDNANFTNVDIILTPYRWTNPAGMSGITAYVKKMVATIEEDAIDKKYSYRNQSMGISEDGMPWS